MQARESCLILKLGNHLVSLSQMSVKPHMVSSIGARWKSFDCSQTFSRSVLILLSCFMYDNFDYSAHSAFFDHQQV